MLQCTLETGWSQAELFVLMHVSDAEMQRCSRDSWSLFACIAAQGANREHCADGLFLADMRVSLVGKRRLYDTTTYVAIVGFIH